MAKSIINGTQHKWEQDRFGYTLRILGIPIATVKDSIHGYYFFTSLGNEKYNSSMDGLYYQESSEACDAAADWINKHSS